MEYMNGGTTLEFLLKDRANINLSISEVRIITNKLVQALRTFKKMGIIHRDLHNNQILIHFKNLDHVSDKDQLKRRIKRKKLLALNNPDDFDVKIIDFGRSI